MNDSIVSANLLGSNMSRKIMIDVDTGVDDAQAIMLALSSPDIEVMAITCVAGNVDIDKVCLNTLKVLKVCDRLDVSIRIFDFQEFSGFNFRSRTLICPFSLYHFSNYVQALYSCNIYIVI